MIDRRADSSYLRCKRSDSGSGGLLYLIGDRSDLPAERAAELGFDEIGLPLDLTDLIGQRPDSRVMNRLHLAISLRDGAGQRPEGLLW